MEKTLESWCSGQKCIPTFPSQMLIEELLNDSGSVKSDEIKEKLDNNYTNKITYTDSDEEINKSKEDLSDVNYEDVNDDRSLSSKIVLPQDLQELVKEALAELKSTQ